MDVSVGYLEITDDNKFVWDIKLNLDIKNYNKNYKWGTAVKDCGDPITKEWYDYEISILDIPPTIFFLGIINTYSVGFSLYIPLDATILWFANELANDIRKLLKNEKMSPNNLLSSTIYNNPENLFFLNTYGKIRSTKLWNYNMAKNGSVHIYCHNNDNNNYHCTGTIQGIVKDCRDFLEKYKY
jgi:hypothetical protein